MPIARRILIAGFPEEAMARLLPELAAIRGNPVLGERIAAGAGRLLMSDPAALEQRLRRELPLWRQVLAEAGIRPE
jgi:hypothetical protein